MKFKDYMNEDSELVFKKRGFTVLFSTSPEHTLDSRLQRAGITLDQLRDKIAIMIGHIKDDSWKFGKYAVRFKDFILIFSLRKKQIFINTILTPRMKYSNVDYKKEILEWIKQHYGIHIGDNEFYLVEDEEVGDICVENADDGVWIHGEKFWIIDMEEV